MISVPLAPSSAIAALYSGIERFGARRRLAAVRGAAARHIAELETRDAKAGRGQRLCRRGHRRRIHRRAGAMRQQDGDARILRAVEQESSLSSQPAVFSMRLEVDELHAARGGARPFGMLVEFEVARPPAPRFGQIAGIEFELGEIEDGVGIVAVERDRLRRGSGAPRRSWPRSLISPARLNQASTKPGSSLMAR